MKKNGTDSAWLKAALDYVPQWLGLQLERFRQPGCSVAIARGGETVAAAAFTSTCIACGGPSPRHSCSRHR